MCQHRRPAAAPPRAARSGMNSCAYTVQFIRRAAVIDLLIMSMSRVIAGRPRAAPRAYTYYLGYSITMHPDGAVARARYVYSYEVTGISRNCYVLVACSLLQ